MKGLIAERKASQSAQLPAPVARGAQVEAVGETVGKREAEIRERMMHIKALLELPGCFDVCVSPAPRLRAAAGPPATDGQDTQPLAGAQLSAAFAIAQKEAEVAPRSEVAPLDRVPASCQRARHEN